MKTYKSDDELVKILLSNGYKEVRALHTNGRLNQSAEERDFAIFNTNVTSQTPHIKLKQGAIKENGLQFYEQAISENQLKTMVCYHKLSGSIRNTIKNKFRYAWQIESVVNFFEDLKRQDSSVSQRISKALRRKILGEYERVVLD
ncbi:MAG TPA: hypothetical protein VE978_12235 [Chitinophagales bacterium]|nr:hypothetical protein [Chitinophagales bacterium]